MDSEARPAPSSKRTLSWFVKRILIAVSVAGCFESRDCTIFAI